MWVFSRDLTPNEKIMRTRHTRYSITFNYIRSDETCASYRWKTDLNILHILLCSKTVVLNQWSVDLHGSRSRDNIFSCYSPYYLNTVFLYIFRWNKVGAIEYVKMWFVPRVKLVVIIYPKTKWQFTLAFNRRRVEKQKKNFALFYFPSFYAFYDCFKTVLRHIRVHIRRVFHEFLIAF